MKRCAALVTASIALCACPALAFADDAPVGSDLNAGGLKPPAPIETNDTSPNSPAQPIAQLDRADKEDSGRGLEFVWLNGEVGAEYLGLETLKSKQLVDGVAAKSKGLGAMYGAGLGARLLAYTFGARFRFTNFEDYQLWTLNAEAGFHVPLGRLEPYGALSAGYASLGDFKNSALVATYGHPKANGVNARIAAGLDYYVTNTLSVGANLSGEVLFLGRSASPSPANPGPFATSTVYSEHGSGIGLSGSLSAVVGLHF